MTDAAPPDDTAPDITFHFDSNVDGMPIHAYVWRVAAPNALLVIAHGAAEHALRYGRFARAANTAGIEVWAADHRGHGQTAGLAGRSDYGESGWDALVADVAQLVGLVREAHPALPIVLLGHSMGSIAAQQFAPDGSASISALILSGSTAVRPLPGAGEPPPVFNLNAAFEPARTAFDWLSRDDAEVDKYVDDPFCGFDTKLMRRPGHRADPAVLADPERLRRVRPDLPCLFIAGAADPINRNLAGLHQLEASWRAAGVRRIDTIYYPGARHEILNETNREEVTRDIITWIHTALPSGPPPAP